MYRVEKYRPNTLDDVSGHQDILATINRFIEHNVGRVPNPAVLVRSNRAPSDCHIFSSTGRQVLARHLQS